MNKEEAYDSEISPLVDKVINLCKEHKIDHILSFYLGDDMSVTTAQLTDELDTPDSYYDALEMIWPTSPPENLLELFNADQDQEVMATITFDEFYEKKLREEEAANKDTPDE